MEYEEDDPSMATVHAVVSSLLGYGLQGNSKIGSSVNLYAQSVARYILVDMNMCYDNDKV